MVNELIERYFRALGWEKREYKSDSFYEADYLFWEAPETLQGTETLTELPNILEHFPSFKKWVLEEMEKRDLYPDIRKVQDEDGNQFLGFSWDELNGVWAEIIDNEILAAAIEAACEHLEGEKG